MIISISETHLEKSNISNEKFQTNSRFIKNKTHRLRCGFHFDVGNVNFVDFRHFCGSANDFLYQIFWHQNQIFRAKNVINVNAITTLQPASVQRPSLHYFWMSKIFFSRPMHGWMPHSVSPWLWFSFASLLVLSWPSLPHSRFNCGIPSNNTVIHLISNILIFTALHEHLFFLFIISHFIVYLKILLFWTKKHAGSCNKSNVLQGSVHYQIDQRLFTVYIIWTSSSLMKTSIFSILPHSLGLDICP